MTTPSLLRVPVYWQQVAVALIPAWLSTVPALYTTLSFLHSCSLVIWILGELPCIVYAVTAPLHADAIIHACFAAT